MPEILSLRDRDANGRLIAYYNALSTTSKAALRRELNERQYRQQLSQTVRRSLPLFFLLSGGDITRTIAAAAIQQEIQLSLQSANVLAKDIFDGRYSPIEATDTAVGQTAKRGIEKLENRLALWAFAAAGVYHLGQEYGPDDERFVWELGETEEHCQTCAGLNGVVLTAAEWRRLRHRPQGVTLACGGWRCDCGRRPTSAQSIGLGSVNV